ncbi:hypothetical protein Lser_V15G37851 [Lactuca serriola]
MLPEIQATVKQPVVGNMMKALYFQFKVGVVPLYAVVGNMMKADPFLCTEESRCM